MDATVEALGKVPVFAPDGTTSLLGATWEGRTVLLAMIRHFG